MPLAGVLPRQRRRAAAFASLGIACFTSTSGAQGGPFHALNPQEKDVYATVCDWIIDEGEFELDVFFASVDLKQLPSITEYFGESDFARFTVQSSSANESPSTDLRTLDIRASVARFIDDVLEGAVEGVYGVKIRYRIRSTTGFTLQERLDVESVDVILDVAESAAFVYDEQPAYQGLSIHDSGTINTFGLRYLLAPLPFSAAEVEAFRVSQTGV